MTDARRSIPSVDRLLGTPEFDLLTARFPRGRVADRLRSELERVRGAAVNGLTEVEIRDPGVWARAVEARLEADEVPSLRRVVNATGVILHTNLGRAPLARAAVEAMTAAAGWASLEVDLHEGTRGSRWVHCAGLLAELTGAEDALVVNNNAAALVLALNTFALGRTVLVSRGELVEIGGAFRVPEILERSGARLGEVGSTNRTRLEDYRHALEEPSADVAAILKVHRSNFRMSGFTEEAPAETLAALAAERGLPLVHDLGTGLMADPVRLGITGEPTVGDAVRAGADVVTFSGDKLLGGPQAGIVVGRAELVQRMRVNPLCRALRVDKVTLAALEATLRLYHDPARAVAEIPTLALLAEPVATLEARARALAERLADAGIPAEPSPGSAVVGGGTCPGVELPSWTVRLAPADLSAAELARRLRLGDPPLVGRVEEDRLVLDLRTLRPEEEADARAALARALASGG